MGSKGREAEPPSAYAAPREARLEAFAARPLELAAVLETLERFAATSLGLRAVRELAPLDDPGARARLARAAEAIRHLARGAPPVLAGVTDPLPLLEAAQRSGRALDEERLVALRGLFEASQRIAQWLAEHADVLPALATLARGMPDFAAVAARIDATLDERGKVRDEASPLLARLRRETSELARDIERALKALVARPEIKAVLSDLATHRRGSRAVLAVKAKSQGRVPGIVHDRSQSGESVFVEPLEIVAHGNRLAERQSDERREEERLLLELSRAVLAERPAIEEAALRIAELELALVAARWAAESAASGAELAPRVPLLPGQKGAATGLLLRSARHPLLLEELRAKRLAEVVPIDLRLGADFDLLILTGPNTGGKTLALKTAGLAALTTRCGLPFPCAEGSTVPLYDGVVADIGDEQEIRQSLSTFSSHLVRIRAGLARAGPKVLFLLDELGGGTDPDEGAALSEALLERLLESGSPTLVSTHIGKLKEFAFRNPRAENASVEFDHATLAPRYRILTGTPGESGALAIARRLGLPHKLVDRAHERLVRRDHEVQKLMADVRVARTQAEKVRSAAETRLEDVARAQAEIEARKVEIERKGELLESEAQKGIEDRVRAARGFVERARALLEQVPASQRKALEETLAGLERELSGTALSDRRQAFLDGLAKGSYVYLPRYRQRVAVQKVDRAAREVQVQLGAMKMRVSFDEVASYDER